MAFQRATLRPAVRLAWAALGMLLAGSLCAETVIGVVTDGPAARDPLPPDLLAREIRDLTGDEFQVVLPEDKRRDGGWSIAGVRAALQRQFDDPNVDIVLAIGVVTGNEAAKYKRLPKPVVAPIVADARLQGLPLAGNKSGKRNFVYLSSFTGVDFEIETFFKSVGFEHLAVLVDRATVESIPALASEKPRELAQQLGIRIDIVDATDDVTAALKELPAGADAVYVTPLLRLGDAGMRQLADGLIERRLPSFSLIGRQELHDGLMMATGGREADQIRVARRISLLIQRILLGENAGDLEVDFRESQRLAINMRTARAIGFSPRYAVLADADQLYDEEVDGGPRLTLSGALAMALESNLDLKTVGFDPLLAGAELRAARSQRLPQLGVGLSRVQIDADRANPFVQPEKSTDAEVTASQVIYSDDLWAAASIAEYLQAAAGDEVELAALDTLQAAARSYLNVLRAKALEAVQRANLEVTRTNLELAQLRESIGFSGRADVLRWESQIATDRQNLIAAESSRRAANTALNRILNRPQNLNFFAPEEDIQRTMAVFGDERFQAFIDNATVWEVFQDFQVQEAVSRAPELRQLDQFIGAQQREVLAARRKYFVPELALAGTAGSNINRSGAGSDLTGLGIDDESWNIALVANWPLFTSGALQARASRARYSVRQLEQQRAAAAEQIEARVRVALHNASGSFPAVELSADAARAANENLGLVTDAYSKGAVSVTDLIDAQNAGLAADLRAAEARYAYLIDLVDVLRAAADFSLLSDPGAAGAWFDRVEAYFDERGVSVRR